MKKHTALAALLSLALLTNPAFSDDRYYVGASLGSSDLNVSTAGASFDDSAFGAFKVFGGGTVSKWLALEAGYFDLGSLKDSVTGLPFELNLTGWQLYSVFNFHYTEQLTVFAKPGVIFWNADISTPGFSIGDEDGTDFAIGVGATLGTSDQFLLRTEFEWFDIKDTNRAWLLSVGAQFRF